MTPDMSPAARYRQKVIAGKAQRPQQVQPSPEMLARQERTSQPHPFLPPVVRQAMGRVNPAMQILANELLHGMDMQGEIADEAGARATDAVSPYVPAQIAGAVGTGAKLAAEALGGPGSVGKAMVGYHGSPHRWMPEPGFPQGRPRLDKIGTGEGYAAQGWGFYSAERPGVGQHYKDVLSTAMPEKLMLNQTEADIAESFEYSDFVRNGIASEFTEAVRKMTARRSDPLGYTRAEFDAALKSLDSKIKARAEGGTRYTLDIPDDDIARYMDWDAPLKDQPQSVKDALKRISVPPTQVEDLPREDLIGILQRIDPNGAYRDADSIADFGAPLTKEELLEIAQDLEVQDYLNEDALNWADGETGESLYHWLTTKFGGGGFEGSNEAQKKASEALRDAGIPGLRYLDRTSRDARARAVTPNWRTYDGDRVARKGWRSPIGKTPYGENVYGYVEPTKDGQYRAWYEKMEPGKVDDVDIGVFSTQKEAQQAMENHAAPTRNFVTWDQDVLDRAKVLSVE